MPDPIIPLFAEKAPHPFVSLGRRPAGARSEGQGRPPAGASRAPFTGASTLAGWRRSGVGPLVALAILLLGSPGAALAQKAGTGETIASAPIAEAAQRFNIPERWIWAVMRAESNGDLRAVSPVGAMGLMQIMPTTWTSLRTRYRLGSDPFDARDNILAGAAYLREMYDRYGDVTAMLAAYNAGPGRTDEYLSRGRPLPVATRAYIAKLASITGGSDDTRLAVAQPPDPFAWRRAALFPTRAGGSSTAATAPSKGTPAFPSAAAAEPVAPRQASLFVPLSDEITR
ncbi:lytic transglycosylase domain-containing protein [Altericroceibacterium spongiae]|uniref:Lytic transglycosylase domain-containing protein n=1 Tax=Altericroceibacterium spongiae TaxID=2320269 RepID=A0A420EPK8_9SPHN|nr:lytic transglycosylase domain-containing protein [Altericroceibacterium spongiae]RKF22618.1 lytic transglycosylase domain-containing protein [Altericroceibacterium spongiae]